MPYFSIVIPTFNRRDLIGRAICSCLAQSFRDYEIIVVDDASTDNTALMIEREFKEQVTLLVHENNRGVCAARTTGIRRSDCRWIVLLDSDDELLPFALSFLFSATATVPSNIGRVACCYRWDDGSISPNPIPLENNLGYEAYLKWSEIAVRSDFHNCIRRDTLDYVPLPNNYAYETAYHLDFAMHYQTLMLNKVIALEHQDAPFSSSIMRPADRKKILMRISTDNFIVLKEALDKHEPNLRTFAPKRLRILDRACLLYAMLAESRKSWLPIYARQINRYGFEPIVAIGAILGLINKDLLAWAQTLQEMHRT